MNKEEFEEKFVVAQGQVIWEKYPIVWQWIEQYGNQQRKKGRMETLKIINELNRKKLLLKNRHDNKN